ncbi:MAG: response regulator [Candidatus Margulisbacteria bacterium]|jgi:DNA-binding response OmpR family regulator|nr:response regulator [Candidatus Margulisiibacteriota bacterium]
MKKVVLIVDDEPTIVTIIGDLLQLSGYDTLSAGDAEEAEQAIRAHRPDLILLDVMMPKTSGFDLCRKLKATPDYKEIPIIFVSVMNKPEDLAKGKELGAADYVPKPFDPNDLLARIKRYCPNSD